MHAARLIAQSCHRDCRCSLDKAGLYNRHHPGVKADRVVNVLVLVASVENGSVVAWRPILGGAENCRLLSSISESRGCRHCRAVEVTRVEKLLVPAATL